MLTQRKIESATVEPGKTRRIKDAPGLYLELRGGLKGVSKRFVWRGTISGAVTHIAIGQYPFVTLEQARDQAIDFKRMTRRGQDPRPMHQAEQIESRDAPTLAHCIREMFAVRAASAKVGRGLVSRQKFAEDHAAPLLSRKVDAITPAEIVAVLQPQWHRQSGRSMRNDIRAALDWAIAAGHIAPGANPAGDPVSAMLPKGGLKSEGRKAVDYADMPGIMKAVEQCDAEAVYKLAWRFMALTATRTIETLNARWTWIDGDVITFPGDIMKSGKPHSVPLCPQAMAALEQARELNPGSEYVFPSPVDSRKPMSVHGLHKVRETVGIRDRMTNHGVRACFSTWANSETSFERHVIEACLAHSIRGVEAHYNRADYLGKRREVHNAYCAFLVATK